MLLLAALSLASTTACATLRKDKTVCAEYREMRCATAPECSYDQGRGCRVCQCSPAGANQDGQLPSGISPDQR